MQGGVRKDTRNRLRKFFTSKTHTYSGIIHWTDTPNIPGTKPAQRNQEGFPDSTSCVAQSKASQINSATGIVASARPIFSHRIGAPASSGMFLYDADNITQTTGTTTEALSTSELMSDAQLDVPYTFQPMIKATGKGVNVPIDADSIASAILTAKAVSVSFESNGQEWDSPNCTPVYHGTPITFGHCISLYGFFLNAGVKTFIANDSDGQWSSPGGTRYITEDFLIKRGTGASYSPGFTVISTDTPVKDPTNTYPNMTPETPKWWSWFWYFLRGGK